VIRVQLEIIRKCW